MSHTFSVEVSDETAEALTNRYERERIVSELQETLSTLAEEAPRRQSELRREVMGLDEEPSDDGEKSEEELAEELREFMSPTHPRSKDPRL